MDGEEALSAGRPARTSLRAAALGGVAGILAAGLAVAVGMDSWSAWEGALAEPSAVPVATGVQLVASASGAVLSGWLAVLLLLGAGTVAPGAGLRPVRSVSRELAPRWAPRVGAALLAATVTGPVAASAVPVSWPGTAWAGAATTSATATATTTAGDRLGAPVPGWETPGREEGGGDVPEPGWHPTSAPVPVAATVETGLVTRGTEPAHTVVVRSGDTLWGVVARQLGEDATAEVIAREWPRWYRANRDVIGPDPDLIHPGQELVPPAVRVGAGGTS